MGNYTFDTSIASAWVLMNGKLEKLNLFEEDISIGKKQISLSIPQGARDTISILKNTYNGLDYVVLPPDVKHFLASSSSAIQRRAFPRVNFSSRPGKSTTLASHITDNGLRTYTKPTNNGGKIQICDDPFVVARLSKHEEE